MTSINEAWRVENKATASKHFTVVGGGLAGALMAVILRRRGYAVTIYERYGDLRTIPSAGRSINLVLTARGLQAIKEIGGEESCQDGAVEFRRVGLNSIPVAHLHVRCTPTRALSTGRRANEIKEKIQNRKHTLPLIFCRATAAGHAHDVDTGDGAGDAPSGRVDNGAEV